MIRHLQLLMLLVLTAGYPAFMSAEEAAADTTTGSEQVLDDSGQPEDAAPASDDHTSIKVEFKLLNSDGKLVTQDDFRGKYLLLTFGYTHCEHICPTVLSDMARTLKGSTGTAGIFISVDTERDTPTRTEEYASQFSEKITGLSGSYEEVAAAANNFNVRYSITKTQNHYMVQHSSDIFYIGPDEQLIKIFTFNSLPPDLEK